MSACYLRQTITIIKMNCILYNVSYASFMIAYYIIFYLSLSFLKNSVNEIVWKKKRLDKMLVDYFLRKSYYDVAIDLVKESGIEVV